MTGITNKQRQVLIEIQENKILKISYGAVETRIESKFCPNVITSIIKLGLAKWGDMYGGISKAELTDKGIKTLNVENPYILELKNYGLQPTK